MRYPNWDFWYEVMLLWVLACVLISVGWYVGRTWERQDANKLRWAYCQKTLPNKNLVSGTLYVMGYNKATQEYCEGAEVY